MIQEPKTNQDPLLKAVSNGLELWIQSQCKVLGELKLELKGSAIELLTGCLAGTHLIGREIKFKDLNLNYVELESGPIKVNINPLNKNNKVGINEDFQIKGRLVITEENLSQILNSERWRSLGELISEKFLDNGVIESLIIRNQRIELSSSSINTFPPKTVNLLIGTRGGDLILNQEDKFREIVLLTDPNININEAIVDPGEIILIGTSKVQL